MKLKLLTLLLTMGLFAFGANAQTEEKEELGKLTAEEQKTIGDPAGTLLCTAINSFTPKGFTLPQVCTDLCAASPNLADMGPCAKEVLKMGKEKNTDGSEKYPWISKVKLAVNTACYAGCTGKNPFGGGSCKMDKVRKACGTICCALAPSKLGGCLTSYSESCSNYMSGEE